MEEADMTDAANTALLLDLEIDRRVAKAIERIFDLWSLPHDDASLAIGNLSLALSTSIETDIIQIPNFARGIESIVRTQIGNDDATQDLIGNTAYQAINASRPFQDLIGEIASSAVSDSIAELRSEVEELTEELDALKENKDT